MAVKAKADDARAVTKAEAAARGRAMREADKALRESEAAEQAAESPEVQLARIKAENSKLESGDKTTCPSIHLLASAHN